MSLRKKCLAEQQDVFNFLSRIDRCLNIAFDLYFIRRMVHSKKTFTKLQSMAMLNAVADFDVVSNFTSAAKNYSSLPSISAEVAS